MDGNTKIEIPCLPICHRMKDSCPKKSKEINKLWSLLSYTGPLVNKDGGISTDIPAPQKFISNLVGESFISDPSSVVRVVSFTNPGIGEPITTGGFVLETYSGIANYKISWSFNDKTDLSKCKHQNIRIGFYTSDTFEFDITNNLFLICGNKGPSIFNSNLKSRYRGSFKCKEINRIYVAVDKEIEVHLKVEAIIPPYIKYPTISPNHKVYTKYITISDKHCNEKKKLAVYTITATDKFFLNLIKRETKCFRKATVIIQNFLNETSLSITLFSPTATDLIVLPDIYRFPELGSYSNVEVTARYSSIITNLFGEKSTYQCSTFGSSNEIVNQGFKTSNIRCRVNYTITSTLRLLIGNNIPITAIVACQQLKGNVWTNYTTIQSMMAIKEFTDLTASTQGSTRTVTGSFDLEILEFGISIYFLPVNDDDFNKFFEINTTFNEIRVEYF